MTRPKRDGAAFEFSGGDAGVLLLHGFSGSPFEMRELGERLHARGYSVFAPTLPGHGGDVRALKAITAIDYLDAAEAAFNAAQSRSSSVYVVGNSMGGALGLHLAQRKLAAALVTINAPVRMAAHVHHGVPFVTRVAANAPLPVNVNALFSVVGYPTVPASAVSTFLAVVEHVRLRLSDVTCPLLVLHSDRDATVPSSNAAAITHGVTSRDKRAIVLEQGQHLMTIGRWLDMIDPLIGDFLARMDRGPARDNRTTAGSS